MNQMTLTISSAQSSGLPAFGLDAIPSLELNDVNHARLTQASFHAGGSPMFRLRKQREVHDLLALCQIAPPGRLDVLELDLRQSLKAVLRMKVPVACRPQPDGPVITLPGAVLGLTFPEEALWRPQAGYSFLEILFPHRVWHPNVSHAPAPVQALCLGPSMPAGVRVTELLLGAYGALQMTTLNVDEMDPAGVMNFEACKYFQDRLDLLPLSRTPFLMPD
jgi:hypothetical protein